MEIREILPWDEAQFYELVEQFYALPAVAHPIPSAHARRTFALLQQDTPYARCFVAEQGRRLVGYCLCAITWSNEAGGLCVWIEELMVREHARGSGIGQALIAAVQAAYPDAARLRLEVTAENTRAAALYQSLGFAPLPYQQLTRDADAAD